MCPAVTIVRMNVCSRRYLLGNYFCTYFYFCTDNMFSAAVNSCQKTRRPARNQPSIHPASHPASQLAMLVTASSTHNTNNNNVMIPGEQATSTIIVYTSTIGTYMSAPFFVQQPASLLPPFLRTLSSHSTCLPTWLAGWLSGMDGIFWSVLSLNKSV